NMQLILRYIKIMVMVSIKNIFGNNIYNSMHNGYHFLKKIKNKI
ncbi:glycosyltransferase, partial [Salmonella enterica]|nr:glycosyltransferase [Salmonella enterica]